MDNVKVGNVVRAQDTKGKNITGVVTDIWVRDSTYVGILCFNGIVYDKGEFVIPERILADTIEDYISRAAEASYLQGYEDAKETHKGF